MVVYYDTETGEVFATREEAIRDAKEQFDFGDPTNSITYLGFPNEELPYIKIEEEQLELLFKTFWR